MDQLVPVPWKVAEVKVENPEAVLTPAVCSVTMCESRQRPAEKDNAGTGPAVLP